MAEQNKAGADGQATQPEGRKAASFSKQTLKNNTDGPKIVNSRTGGITLQPGEEQEIEISADELASLKAVDFLNSAGGDVPDLNADGDRDALTRMKRDQLVDLAKREDVEHADNATKDEIADAILAKRQA